MKVRAVVLVALLALAAAVIVGVIQAKPVGARPNQEKDCAQCHGDGTYAATVTATPSTSTPAPGATYTVAIAISENPNGTTFNTGYWIANSTAAGATGTSVTYGGNTGTPQSYTVNMTAPSTPGTYYYKVFMVDGGTDNTGIVGYRVFSIVVGTPAVHDVAVDSLRHYARKGTALVGDTDVFIASYANRGTVSETFTATLAVQAPGGATSTLDTRGITLAAGATMTVRYEGVPTYSSAGLWTVTATAGPVSGETVTLNNTLARERTVRSTTSALPAAGSLRSTRRGPAR